MITLEDVQSGASTGLFRYHWSLRRADEYFGDRAVNPVAIEDETIVHEPADGMIVSAVTFKSGKSRVQMNAFHDMIPAIWAYISLLDHDLVLALAFSGFDPAKDDLTSMIGSRWGRRGPAERGGAPAGSLSCYRRGPLGRRSGFWYWRCRVSWLRVSAVCAACRLLVLASACG
jgi:hypothetical protein